MAGELPIQHGYVDAVIGCHWGDEGKGLEVDRRAGSGEYGGTARFNGGANAGHETDQVTLHQVPSGITHPDMFAILGNGSLVDPVLILSEFEDIRRAGFPVTPENLKISDTAHFVMPHHKITDALREAGAGAQGSTKRGIGPCASDKYGRENARTELLTWNPGELQRIAIDGLHKANLLVRHSHIPPAMQKGLIEKNPEEVYEQWLESAQAIAPYITDTVSLIHEKLEEGVSVLAEGAQAVGLDMEQGAYPLNSSSHATPGGALNGLGIGHHYLRKIIGVAKLTTSRVGGENGPFVTKVHDEEVAARLRGKLEDKDGEWGKSTKRPRDMGFPDAEMMRFTVKVVGITELVLTKLDLVERFGEEVKVAVGYEIGGERLKLPPRSAEQLKYCKPIYRTFKTWQEDISEVRRYNDLPDEAKKLVEGIEEVAGVPVTRLGVGPQRDQVIIR